MNELVNLLTTKVGLPADKAQQAIDVVLHYVQDKLPAPISGQLSNIMGQQGGGSQTSGTPPNQQDLGGIAGSIGNVFKK